MTESTTPRTDAAAKSGDFHDNKGAWVNLCRQLEAELAEARKAISEGNSGCEDCYENGRREGRRESEDYAASSAQLVDRALKMMVLAGFQVTVHDPEANNPIVAWMADARNLLARMDLAGKPAVEPTNRCERIESEIGTTHGAVICDPQAAHDSGADPTNSRHAVGRDFIERLREHIVQFVEDLSDEYKDSPSALGALGRTMKFLRRLEINLPENSQGNIQPFKCCGAGDCPSWEKSCQNPANYAEDLFAIKRSAERMVQTFRDWMAGCDNNTRWKEVEAAHINLRDTLAQSSPATVSKSEEADRG